METTLAASRSIRTTICGFRNTRTLELRAAYQGLTFQNTKHMAGPYDLSNFAPGSSIVATCHVNLLNPDMLECSFTS